MRAQRLCHDAQRRGVFESRLCFRQGELDFRRELWQSPRKSVRHGP